MISNELQKLGLISGDKIGDIFDELYLDILTRPIVSEAKFIEELWERYDNRTPSLNGSVFEGLLATLFYRQGITPLYVQAKLAFVPNVDFDFVAYSKAYGPIILSAKTSLRERYKQADLEGMMVRQVHRKAKSYLITLHEKEARSVNEKIDKGQVLGIDSVVIATDNKFDQLISKLKNVEFCQPPQIEVLVGSRIISSIDN